MMNITGILTSRTDPKSAVSQGPGSGSSTTGHGRARVACLADSLSRSDLRPVTAGRCRRVPGPRQRARALVLWVSSARLGFQRLGQPVERLPEKRRREAQPEAEVAVEAEERPRGDGHTEPFAQSVCESTRAESGRGKAGKATSPSAGMLHVPAATVSTRRTTARDSTVPSVPPTEPHRFSRAMAAKCWLGAELARLVTSRSSTMRARRAA